MLSESSLTRPASADHEKVPNLFMVGAPKCGTTALATYLTQHPDVFVASKELNFFGKDLDFRTRRGAPWQITEDAYLAWFAQAGDRRYRGDHSVFYLYSKSAAQEIREASPRARVIIMLRNPVDQMYSQHSEMVFQGDEDLKDFSRALEAEEYRRRGERVPSGCQKVFGLFYRDLARYSSQVERYIATFGRSMVHVVLHEDLASDPAFVYGQVLEFLGVSVDQSPSFDVVNPNKVARSDLVMAVLRRAPRSLRWAGRAVVRDQYRRASLRRRLHAMNTLYKPRAPMDAGMRRSLEEEFRPEVQRLEQVLGRDLGVWHAPERRSVRP